MNNFLLIIVLGLCITFCSSSSKLRSTNLPPLPEHSVFIPLAWKPLISSSNLNLPQLSVYRNISISISLEEMRNDPRIIGKTLEDKKIQGTFVPIVTNESVIQWMDNGISKTLKEMRIPKQKKGDLRLDIEIIECAIDDNITQHAYITLQVHAQNSDDLLIWEGKISGISELYSRPKESDGLSECLSNALKVTITNLLTDSSFEDAVKKAF